jgi:Methyltransferase domain
MKLSKTSWHRAKRSDGQAAARRLTKRRGSCGAFRRIIGSDQTPNVRFLTVDGTKLPFDDNEFDFVATHMVTHHIPDWQNAPANAESLEAKRLPYL